MAILVTGGAGYIGSHTCIELLGAGEEVVILDNFSNAKLDIPERIEKISGKKVTTYAVDILDKRAISNVFKKENIEAVIHFAGLKAVGESVQVPLSYYQNNIAGTLNLCEVMMENGCKNMVFSSSATVYGTSKEVPFHEDLPTSATNPYGMTKLVIERVLQDLAASDSEWSIALLRYFNPIGAHESGLIGENPNGIPNNLLPYIAKVATRELAKLNIYGNDYDTPDGTGVRDYLHVVDLAIGHLKALDFIRKNKGAEPINLGTGKGYSVLEVVAAFEKANNIEIPYTICERRGGDIATCYANPAKAKSLLGWEAKLGIEQMCKDTWNFAKNNFQAV